MIKGETFGVCVCIQYIETNNYLQNVDFVASD